MKSSNQIPFEAAKQALVKAQVPCRLKDTDRELVIEFGWNWPESLVDQVYRALPNFKGSLCAEQHGGAINQSVDIAGGPRRY